MRLQHGPVSGPPSCEGYMQDRGRPVKAKSPMWPGEDMTKYDRTSLTD